MSKTLIYEKIMRIIKSCNTAEQLIVAEKMIYSAKLRHYFNNDNDNVFLIDLERKLHEQELELYNRKNML